MCDGDRSPDFTGTRVEEERAIAEVAYATGFEPPSQFSEYYAARLGFQNETGDRLVDSFEATVHAAVEKAFNGPSAF
jgi:AraC-like DNA-binding protein